MTGAKRLCVAAAMTLGACASGGLTPAASPAPIPIPAPPPPPPVAAAPARIRLPLTASGTYRVQLQTELERDSAGRTERDVLVSSALVTLEMQRNARGSLRGAGRVDSFLVADSERRTTSAAPTTSPTSRTNAPVPAPAPPMSGAGAPTPPLASVSVDVVLDSAFLRATVRPPLANECDRPEAAAANVARDVMVRVPIDVGIGDTWSDSLLTLVCRGSVPMVVRTMVQSEAVALIDGGRTLQVKRMVTTTLEGSSRTPWLQMTITGNGSGTQMALVDVGRGVLTALDGESTLTVRVSNGALQGAARSQQVVQKLRLTARLTRTP